MRINKYLLIFALFFPINSSAFSYTRTPGGSEPVNPIRFESTQVFLEDIVGCGDTRNQLVIFTGSGTNYGDPGHYFPIRSNANAVGFSTDETANLGVGTVYGSTASFTFDPSDGAGGPPTCDINILEYSSFAPRAATAGPYGTSGAPVEYRPEVFILSPQKTLTFGNKVKIEYRAKDKNNDGSGLERERFGLGKESVSIYYADGIELLGGRLVADEDKKLIAKGLPASTSSPRFGEAGASLGGPTDGIYEWDAKDLPDGGQYRIIVDAADNYGEIGEAVSDEFSIDHSAPTFKVLAEPAVTRGEDVKITVESSKELATPPKVLVKQKGLEAKRVEMISKPPPNPLLRKEGEIISPTLPPYEGGKEGIGVFEGIYNVISGYDGVAAITVEGTDTRGNVGNLITSGGRFAVGVEPPPKPIIYSPLDKDIFASSTISIKGKAREDTKVILTVNNVQNRVLNKLGVDGSFIIENIELSPDFNKGVNILSIVARDEGGLESEPAILSIKYNIEPEVEILPPVATTPLLSKEGTGEVVLSGTSTLKILSSDKNNDKLFFKYEIAHLAAKPPSENDWIVLAEKSEKKQFLWETFNYSDGDYLLRVTADDGFAKVEKISAPFKVQNYLTKIILDEASDPPAGEAGKIVSASKDIIIKGKAVSPDRPGLNRFGIFAVEYNLNDSSWLPASAGDGEFNSFEENFTISLKDLPEGAHKVLFRARDARKYFGRASKTIIVDFGPPSTPSVQIPRPPLNPLLTKEGNGEVVPIVSDTDDLDENTVGVQFLISGKSEPESIVHVVLGDRAFTGKTDTTGIFNVRATLREHGRNDFKIFAEDLAGNKSVAADFTVIYNNPPTLKILSPREGRGLNHKAIVKWEASDRDGDEIESLVLSYRKGVGDFRVLGTWRPGRQVSKLEWDVSNFVEAGDYELKLEALDGPPGLAPGEAGVSGAIITRKFFIDNTAPSTNLNPLKETRFKKAFTLVLEGSASDNFSGVEFVEYSINNISWFKALITSGYLSREVVFRVNHPFKLEDGKYSLRVRSVDAAGNLSEEATQEIVVDTTPPRVGSFTLSKGAITLLPEGGTFKILMDTKILMDISLERDTVKASLGGLAAKWIELLKNKSTGLWEAELSFIELGPPGFAPASPNRGEPGEAGKFDLLVSAEDDFGNKIESASGGKKIGEIEIIRRGKTEAGPPRLGEAGAKLTVFQINPEDQSKRAWQGEAYGAKNPVISDEKGEYELLLPAGKYQILVQKSGFERLRISEFEILNPKFIDFDFKLEPRKGIKGAIENLLESIGF